MGLSKLFTNICSCSSAQKSPPPPGPASPNAIVDESLAPTKAAQITVSAQSWNDPKAATTTTMLEENHVVVSQQQPPSASHNQPQPDKAEGAALQSPNQVKAAASSSADKAPAAGGDAAQMVELAEGDKGGEPAKGPDMEVVLRVFGFEVSQQLQGKAWDERAQAVQSVRTKITQRDFEAAEMDDFFQGCCSVAQVALKDKVMPVYLEGLDLAKLLLGEFFEGDDKYQEMAREGVHTLLPIILAKASDRNARSMEGTQSALVYIARQPLVGCQAVTTHMLLPIASAKEVAAIRGRLELITQFISEFGFKSAGMSLSAVMGFVRPHLDATDEKVRRAAVEVTVQCYQLKGERTRKFCANLKPALLKLLEQRFAEVDGIVKPKNLPALKGLKARKNIQSMPGAPSGRPSAAAVSRGSSRNSRDSSSAGSVGSLGKHLGMPMPPGKPVLSPKPLRMPIQEDPFEQHDELLTNDPFDIVEPEVKTFHGADPSFIPSPTSAPLDLYGNDDESIMREIEGF